MKRIVYLLIVLGAFTGNALAFRDLETGTFLTRDPIGYADGPNVYCYVHCNPITHFDPLGLSVDTAENYNELTNTRYIHIWYKASLVNNSKDYPDIDKSAVATRLEAQMEATYSGSGKYKGENVVYKTHVDIKAVESVDEIRKGDHTIELRDGIPNTPHGMKAGGYAKIGSKKMQLNAQEIKMPELNGSPTGVFSLDRSGTHEGGHNFGLHHPNPADKNNSSSNDRWHSEDNTIPLLSAKNIMRTGTEAGPDNLIGDPSQAVEVVQQHKNGNLNKEDTPRPVREIYEVPPVPQ